MILLQKDILIELLKTESVPAIGVLLLFLAISLFSAYKLYEQIINIRDEHKREIAQIMQDHAKEVKLLHKYNVDAHKEFSDRLVDIIKMNNQTVSILKDMADRK